MVYEDMGVSGAMGCDEGILVFAHYSVNDGVNFLNYNLEPSGEVSGSGQVIRHFSLRLSIESAITLAVCLW